MAVCLFVLVYASLQANMMFRRNDTQFATKSIQKDMVQDTELHFPFDKEFRLAFEFIGDDMDLFQQPDYITYEIKHIERWYEGDTRFQNETILDLTQCEQEFLDEYDASLGRNAFGGYCLTEQDYTIAANYGAPVYHYL